MLQKTRGILLHRINYSETSIIIRVYTENLGLQSFILKGVRSGKSKIRTGFLQPLALLELEFNHRPAQNLQHLREIRPAIQLISIPFDVHKSAVILFLDEVLIKCLTEEEPDRNLFEFIYNSIELFDLQEKAGTIFHLFFLVKLTMYLGFFPKGNFSETNCFFNMHDGKFCDVPGESAIGLPYSRYIHLLMEHTYKDPVIINIPNTEKPALIDQILRYYSFHLPSFGNIKSHKILHQVFN